MSFFTIASVAEQDVIHTYQVHFGRREMITGYLIVSAERQFWYMRNEIGRRTDYNEFVQVESRALSIVFQDARDCILRLVLSH